MRKKKKRKVKVIPSNRRLQIMKRSSFFPPSHAQKSKHAQDVFALISTCNNIFKCGRVWVCVCIPLFAVLAHTHSSSMARGRVAAGALTDLEADAAAGAAGRPDGPGSPRSVSMATQHQRELL